MIQSGTFTAIKMHFMMNVSIWFDKLSLTWIFWINPTCREDQKFVYFVLFIDVNHCISRRYFFSKLLICLGCQFNHHSNSTLNLSVYILENSTLCFESICSHNIYKRTFLLSKIPHLMTIVFLPWKNPPKTLTMPRFFVISLRKEGLRERNGPGPTKELVKPSFRWDNPSHRDLSWNFPS